MIKASLAIAVAALLTPAAASAEGLGKVTQALRPTRRPARPPRTPSRPS